MQVSIQCVRVDLKQRFYVLNVFSLSCEFLHARIGNWIKARLAFIVELGQVYVARIH